jgi:hypothetical protein
MFLERILDVAMLEGLDGIGVEAWPQRSLLADPAGRGGEVLAPLLEQTLRESFPERAGGDPLLAARLANTFLDASFFYMATSPEPAAGMGLVERIVHAGREKGMEATAYLHPTKVTGGIDFLNRMHSEWLYPCEPGIPRRESVRELFDAAVRDARSAMGPFFAQGERLDETSMALAIGNENLSLSAGNGERCSPVCFSAFDLERILFEEYEKRLQGF